MTLREAQFRRNAPSFVKNLSAVELYCLVEAIASRLVGELSPAALDACVVRDELREVARAENLAQLCGR